MAADQGLIQASLTEAKSRKGIDKTKFYQAELDIISKTTTGILDFIYKKEKAKEDGFNSIAKNIEEMLRKLAGSSEQLGGMQTANVQKLKDLKQESQKLAKLIDTGQVTTADNLPRPDDAKLADTFKETNLRWNNDVGAFETPNGDVATQADIKTYAADNPMEIKVGEEPLKVATNKSVLKNVGRTLATIGAPLPTALIDGYFINEQVKEGKGTAEIASNPLNWLGLATMSTLSDISGVSKPGKLNAALRLGLNPGTIRGISRFAGLPGLAVSTALTAYDQYKKYQNEEGFIYNLFNKEEK